MCETPSVAVVIIDAGSLFAEGLDLEIAAILVSKNQSKSIQQFLCPVIAVLWKNCEKYQANGEFFWGWGESQKQGKLDIFGLEVGKAGSGMGQKKGKLEEGKAQSGKLEL